MLVTHARIRTLFETEGDPDVDGNFWVDTYPNLESSGPFVLLEQRT
jgi:hypothetical protein